MSASDESEISQQDLKTFLKAFVALQEAANLDRGGGSDELRLRAEEHLGTDPSELESATTSLLISDAVNQQLAIDALDPAAELLGIDPNVGMMGRGITLRSLMAERSYIPNGVMPVSWTDRPVDVGRRQRCAQAGVWLATVDRQPVVVALWPKEQHGPMPGGLHLEVLATEPAVAQTIVDRLEELRTEHNVYRGRVLGFTFSEYGEFGLEFIATPPVTRDQLVLPDADLAAIERHTIGIAARADELGALGHHLKRGLLLYGPPGTGKTHTVSYLVNAMPGRTTVVLQGPSAGAIGQAAGIARAFTPATIVIEDVDLIARDRGMGFGENPMLFQLLNEMDGFADDADLLFVLTTNRAEVLEPALASRPGRIDQAIEIAKPDAEARTKLLSLYLEGTNHTIDDSEQAIERLEGVTASFMKELCRRASLNALDAGAPIDGAILDTTITELLEYSAPIVHSSLGATDAPPGLDDGYEGGPGGLHFEF